jgi:hypothetical protein
LTRKKERALIIDIKDDFGPKTGMFLALVSSVSMIVFLLMAMVRFMWMIVELFVMISVRMYMGLIMRMIMPMSSMFNMNRLGHFPSKIFIDLFLEIFQMLFCQKDVKLIVKVENDL